MVPSRVRRVIFMNASLGAALKSAVRPVASIPFLSEPPWRDRRRRRTLASCRRNDRDAPSIEQCVFFDRLISLAYEYRNGDAGELRHGDGCDTAAVARLRSRAGSRELLGSRAGYA